MPGVAHMASLKIVLEREKKRKKKTAKSPFEQYIQDLVDKDRPAIKGKGDAQGDVEQQYPWFYLHYELEELQEPPNDAPLSSKFLYYYDLFAYYLNNFVVKNKLFESFILLSIVCVGVAIGLGLDGVDKEYPGVAYALDWLEALTFWIFLGECVIKIMGCGSRPWLYFTAKDDGSFNSFDFALVAVSVAFSPYVGADSDVSDVKVLRLARLLRLLDFIQFVPELKVILYGLAAALDSVWYILLLLVLVIYIFAVLGVTLFGLNDPANFGTVPMAMLTLFQVSTFCNWSAIALVSYHGCDVFSGNGYVNGYQPSVEGSGRDIVKHATLTGGLPTWVCSEPAAQPVFTVLYFVVYTIVSGMVIMSLFIGVITIGMFTGYQNHQEQLAMEDYATQIDSLKSGVFDDPTNPLRVAVDRAMEVGESENDPLGRSYHDAQKKSHSHEVDQAAAEHKKLESMRTRNFGTILRAQALLEARNEEFKDAFQGPREEVGASSKAGALPAVGATRSAPVGGGAPAEAVNDDAFEGCEGEEGRLGVSVGSKAKESDVSASSQDYTGAAAAAARAANESAPTAPVFYIKGNDDGVLVEHQLHPHEAAPTPGDIRDILRALSSSGFHQSSGSLTSTLPGGALDHGLRPKKKKRKRGFLGTKYHELSKNCEGVTESPYFQNLITLCICVAGCTVGLAADERGDQNLLEFIDNVCLVVFTVEAAVRIVACGERPQVYFKDSWNVFDFLIVTNGWLGLLQVFQSDFFVVFRLLRLLRVFRLAKALPRLRSIVDSLLEAFGSVGWMVLLMFIFNYIASCCGMILFQKHDPFFYGSVLQATFTTYQITTQDVWDATLRINMYDCATFPRQFGYPLGGTEGSLACASPKAFGFVGFAYFLVVIIVGALILPTMLIGVVAIKFEQASNKFENERHDQLATKGHIAVLQEDMGDFFDDDRVEMWRLIFKSIDVDAQGRLDLNEISPLVTYLIHDYLGLSLTLDQIENVVLLFDQDDTGDLNLGEVLTLIRYIIKAKQNPHLWGATLAPPPVTTSAPIEAAAAEAASHKESARVSIKGQDKGVSKAHENLPASVEASAPPPRSHVKSQHPEHDRQVSDLPPGARSPMLPQSPLPVSVLDEELRQRCVLMGFSSVEEVVAAMEKQLATNSTKGSTGQSSKDRSKRDSDLSTLSAASFSGTLSRASDEHAASAAARTVSVPPRVPSQNPSGSQRPSNPPSGGESASSSAVSSSRGPTPRRSSRPPSNGGTPRRARSGASDKRSASVDDVAPLVAGLQGTCLDGDAGSGEVRGAPSKSRGRAAPFSRQSSTDSVATNYLPSDPHVRPRGARYRGPLTVESEAI